MSTRHAHPASTQGSASFALPAVPKQAWAMLLILALPPVGLMLYLIAVEHPDAAVAGIGLVLVLVILGVLALYLRRRTVTLHGGILDIRATFYRKRVAVAELDLEHARIVDLDEHRELRPVLKSNGYALPSFYAGHFRLRGGFKKAFCLLTGHQRVLWIPLRDGGHLLLSVEQPHTLLERLRSAQ